jgi:NitT/TauT family transport system permease protein
MVIVIWQWAGNGGSLFGGVLPTPDKVWQAWKVWAFGASGLSLNPYSGTWLANLLFSAERVAKGFVAAILVAVPVGLAIGWNRIASGALDPTVQLLRPIPITAWLPFSIAVFGIRDMGAVFLIALGAFYPIVVNTAQGARDVERNLVRAAMMMGAGRWTILRRVVLPASLPSIFTGLRSDSASPGPRSSSPKWSRSNPVSAMCCGTPTMSAEWMSSLPTWRPSVCSA